MRPCLKKIEKRERKREREKCQIKVRWGGREEMGFREYTYNNHENEQEFSK